MLECVNAADISSSTGLPVLGEIDEPGFLEGGDYFAAGEDLALVGVGLRSNIEACEQLMNRDWLGTDRLAVVRDDFEQHQVSSLPFWKSAEQAGLHGLATFDTLLWLAWNSCQAPCLPVCTATA